MTVNLTLTRPNGAALSPPYLCEVDSLDFLVVLRPLRLSLQTMEASYPTSGMGAFAEDSHIREFDCEFDFDSHEWSCAEPALPVAAEHGGLVPHKRGRTRSHAASSRPSEPIYLRRGETQPHHLPEHYRPGGVPECFVLLGYDLAQPRWGFGHTVFLPGRLWRGSEESHRLRIWARREGRLRPQVVPSHGL